LNPFAGLLHTEAVDWQAGRYDEQLRARAKGQGKPNGRQVYHLQRTKHGLVFVTNNVTQA
jgi:hypothetical protein